MTEKEILSEREEILEIIASKKGPFVMTYMGTIYDSNLEFFKNNGLEINEIEQPVAQKKGNGEKIKVYRIKRI